MSELMRDLIRRTSGRKLFEASKVLEAERQKLLTGPDRQEPEVIFEINDLEDLSARLRDWGTTLTAFPAEEADKVRCSQLDEEIARDYDPQEA